MIANVPKAKNKYIPVVIFVLWVLTTLGVVWYVRTTIAFIATETVISVLRITEPAIKWNGVKILNEGSVKIDTVLNLEYLAIVSHQCPADLQTFLISPDGSAAFRWPSAPDGYLKPIPGVEQVYPVAVLIEDPKPPQTATALLKPGRYCFRTNAVRYCDPVQFDSAMPDACFELIR